MPGTHPAPPLTQDTVPGMPSPVKAPVPCLSPLPGPSQTSLASSLSSNYRLGAARGSRAVTPIAQGQGPLELITQAGHVGPALAAFPSVCAGEGGAHGLTHRCQAPVSPAQPPGTHCPAPLKAPGRQLPGGTVSRAQRPRGRGFCRPSQVTRAPPWWGSHREHMEMRGRGRVPIKLY